MDQGSGEPTTPARYDHWPLANGHEAGAPHPFNVKGWRVGWVGVLTRLGMQGAWRMLDGGWVGGLWGPSDVRAPWHLTLCLGGGGCSLISLSLSADWRWVRGLADCLCHPTASSPIVGLGGKYHCCLGHDVHKC